MRVGLDGHDEVRVGTLPEAVVAALAEPEELLGLLDGMLRPTSTPARWVMAEVGMGPVRLAPAVDVTVGRGDAREVTVVGVPVAGHTPAHLDLVLAVRGGEVDLASTLATRWQVAVEVPGPQLLVATVRPVMLAGSRSVMRQVAQRLQHRFGRPPT